jgi:hypothetical protein
VAPLAKAARRAVEFVPALGRRCACPAALAVADPRHDMGGQKRRVDAVFRKYHGRATTFPVRSPEIFVSPEGHRRDNASPKDDCGMAGTPELRGC